MRMFLSTVAVATCLVAPGAQAQSVLTAAGRITAVEGNVSIDRGARTGLTAGPRLLLFPGDIVKSVSGGRAELRLRGETVHIGPQLRSYEVKVAPASVFAQLDEAVAQLYYRLFGADKPDPPQFPLGRGAGEPPPPRIRADALLPPGRQWMPIEARHGAFIWQDGGARIVATLGGKSRAMSSDGFAFAQVPLGDGQATVTASGGGIDLQWSVERGDVPQLPWQGAGGAKLTDEQRIARALWLLQNKPEWHLFALTELADLRNAHFLAQEAWSAAITIGLSPVSADR